MTQKHTDPQYNFDTILQPKLDLLLLTKPEMKIILHSRL